MDMMGFDPTSLGLDAAKVAAVNELSNALKEHLESLGWGPKLSRLYVLLPFLSAAVLCTIMNGLWTANWQDVAKCTLGYGAAATAAWRAYKVTVKGE